MEKEIFFNCGNIRLEGLYARSSGSLGAVISHPHPLMGGDMCNSVVEILKETLFAAGISTLRFNFRGVGRSAGSFDEGRGEQDDLLAAIAFLEEQGIREIVPAGYSFGAWVTAGVLARKNQLPAILVSPPVALFGFDFPALGEKVGLIVCGDRDPYCPAEEIKAAVAGLCCRFDLIPAADHFFRSREEALSASIREHAKSIL